MWMTKKWWRREDKRPKGIIHTDVEMTVNNDKISAENSDHKPEPKVYKKCGRLSWSLLMTAIWRDTGHDSLVSLVISQFSVTEKIVWLQWGCWNGTQALEIHSLWVNHFFSNVLYLVWMQWKAEASLRTRHKYVGNRKWVTACNSEHKIQQP